MTTKLIEKLNKTECNNLTIRLTKQAETILERFNDFPIDHFITWWKTKHVKLDGAMIFEYLQADDGLIKAPKEVKNDK